MFEYNNVNISKMNKDELTELKELIENEIDDINLMLKINIVGMFNFASLSLFLLFKEYLKYSNGYNVFDSKEIDRFILILSLSFCFDILRDDTKKLKNESGYIKRLENKIKVYLDE